MQLSKKRITKYLLVLTALLLTSDTLHAQTGVSSTFLEMEIPRSALQARGYRVMFLKPIFDISSEGSTSGQKTYGGGRANDVGSISIGYAFLPIEAIGWSTNLGYLKLKDKNEEVDLMKLDANVGFALNRTVAISAGPNLSKFTSGDIAKQLKAGVGYQIFVSVQSTDNVGIDVGYISMKQHGDAQVNSSTVNYKLEERGPTLGLHVTFE